MITNSTKGFFKDRFPELNGDSFDCGICYLVCIEPKECMKCGTMYCGPCIDDWVSKKDECPIGCSDARNNIMGISGALAKIYKNMNVKCKYLNCGKTVKLSDLIQHEAICQLPQCEFYQICENNVKPEFKDQAVCGLVCQFMRKIKNANGDWKIIYEELRQFSKSTTLSLPISPSGMNTAVSFWWDNQRMGQGIQITNDKKTAYLKENAYMFRSVISDTPLMGGVHYWEIVADPNTENELKIGVTMKRDFNYNTAFCDYEFGFAYYGLAQLRHNSNSLGGAYGKKFKKTGVLGVCLDMNKGTLSFGMDGECWGKAYESEALKRGPAFAAVALLHNAGCTLETGKPVPSWFLGK